MSKHVDHTVVWETAKAITQVVAPAFRDEELKDVFAEVVEVLSAMLIKRDELLARERKRLGRPSEN